MKRGQALTLRAGSSTCKLVSVVSDDTIRVMHQRRAERLRLWGIDCPESRQPFSSRTRPFTGDLAFGKDVRVILRDVDRYGRTVGEVILPEGRSLNRELVKAGFARRYREYAPGDRELERVEAEVRNAKRGLWVDEEPLPPWEWRKSSSVRRHGDERRERARRRRRPA